MHDEFPDLTFNVTTKVEHLLKRRTLLGELAELGCIFVVSAVESLSDRALQELGKGHTREDVFEALSLLRQAGIVLRPTWVAFTPWSGLDDYLEMLEWVSAEGLIDQVDSVQYAIRLLVPPGSMLLHRPGLQPYLGPLEPETLSYKWSHPDPAMDALQGDVARLVEQATAAKQDLAEIFEQVRSLAWSVAGSLPPPVRKGFRGASGIRPPRLTEPWFC